MLVGDAGYAGSGVWAVLAGVLVGLGEGAQVGGWERWERGRHEGGLQFAWNMMG